MRKQKRSRIRLYNEQRPRITAIANNAGLKTLPVLSLNPDRLLGTEKQKDLLRELQKHKIHIAAIQETHIPYDQNYKLNGYRIITCKAKEQEINGMAIGGVAILIREELEHHITHIHRVGRRIM